MEIITSLDNASVKQARSLQDKKYRKFHGHFLLEGKKQVESAINRNFVVDKIFVDQSKITQYENIIAKTDAPVLFVSTKVLNSICDTGTPQGIVAEMVLPEVKPYKHLPGENILVLDNISDPGNMGTIIRTAVATGIKNIFVINCADTYSPKVVRSTCGGIFDVNIYPTDAEEITKLCEKNNIRMLVADMYGENIFTAHLPECDYAVVVGNEGHGVCQELKQNGYLIKLPMKENMESLNASVSASVIMYILQGKKL